MSNFESPRTYRGGQWSPPQSYEESQGYRDPHEMTLMTGITDPSPRTHEGYWNSPPIPPTPRQGWAYDAKPGQQDAPEVVPYTPTPHHDINRPLSPSSQGGTTLHGLNSPPIPPLDLREKDAPEVYTAPVPYPRRCGIRKAYFNIIMILLVVLLVLGLALGLGLGLGLKKKGSSDPSSKIDPFCRDHPELCLGGALGEQYYSKKGAFNGSGIALAGESWNKEGHHIFTLYFQHWTGDIRYMQYTTEKKWIGGTRSETVATDAKNATALSTVAYSLNSTSYFHVFYISKANIVKQVTYTNTTNIWQQGPLNKLNLTIYDTPGNVGLQACWKGNFYGDSDFTKMPTADGKTNTIPFSDRRAMNIWIPVDDSTFQQYAWFNEAPDEWGMLDRWQGKNVHAGVGCYSWGEGTTSYTMMINKANDTEIWWKDTDANITSTEQHPVQSWQNATKGVIPDVHPATSLGYTTFLIAQMADRSVRGFNVTMAAENTTIVAEDTFTISNPAGPVKGLPGTHLTNTAYKFPEGADSLYVFYQTVGDDITAFTRPMLDGEWSMGQLVIPDE